MNYSAKSLVGVKTGEQSSTYAFADECAKQIYEGPADEYHRHVDLEHGLVLLADDQTLAEQRVKRVEEALRTYICAKWVTNADEELRMGSCNTQCDMLSVRTYIT
jgi:hypothetical protein